MATEEMVLQGQLIYTYIWNVHDTKRIVRDLQRKVINYNIITMKRQAYDQVV